MARSSSSTAYVSWGIFGLIVIGLIAWGVWAARQPGKYDDFAKCLGDKGAKFYGAFWCPHCQNQKGMFGKSKKYLPYIECSLPSGSGQTDICKEQKIDGYPTWEFADGSREGGEVVLSRLSEKTGCALPQ